MAKTDGPIAADSKSTSSIALQAASEDIWSQKYRLSSKDGTPIDQTVDDTAASRPCPGRRRTGQAA